MARKRYTAKQEQIPRFAPFLRQGRRDDSLKAGACGQVGSREAVAAFPFYNPRAGWGICRCEVS